ncbi:hypothetical protein B0T14DRAFT_499645 [Immersiella caudata]|uniref:Uncharacterized protein n=1 Tax=Immersiella caudata TaxID=314043 RepID=A0AA39WFB9_9PEZI|nr:hypothetical protein B0T14DRAFT_499645 [Immersiella caudata]
MRLVGAVSSSFSISSTSFFTASIDRNRPDGIPEGGVRIAEDLKNFFGDAIPTNHQLLRSTLELVREIYPNHPVVIPYDPTPENLALWKTIYDSPAPMDTLVNNHWTSLMRPLGATHPSPAPSGQPKFPRRHHRPTDLPLPPNTPAHPPPPPNHLHRRSSSQASLPNLHSQPPLVSHPPFQHRSLSLPPTLAASA